MSSDVAIYNASVPDRMRYASALAEASLLPPAYRAKPANVLLALEYGAALGIAPMAAIQGIHVIEGKPTASAGLIGALVRKAGHRLRVSGDDQHAVCEIVRGDDPDFTFRSEWTMDRARAAGLTGKQVWKNYPAAMLKARAITEAARDACPEALSGVNHTAEELGDDSPAEAFPTTVEVVTETDSGAGDSLLPPGDAGDGQPAAAPESPVIEDAVVVEDWPTLIADATTVDEVRAIWRQIGEAGAMTEDLRDALNDRARVITSASGIEDRVADTSGPATRGDLQTLTIRLGRLGIKDRQDRLDWTGAVVGRVLPSSKDLTHDEALHAIAVAAAQLAEPAPQQMGA